MKRYNIMDSYQSSFPLETFEDENGEWVRIDDVVETFHKLLSAIPLVLNKPTIRDILDTEDY